MSYQPLNMSVSDIVAMLKEKRGIDDSSQVRDEMAEIVPAKRDFWQEGLQQEYKEQKDFESLIGEY